MATILDIVYGSTTINLASGNFQLVHYTPRHATREIPFIKEPARVLLTGSETTMQTELENLRLAFKQAERRFDKKRGDRVYWKYQLDGLSTKFRSEMIRPAKDRVAGGYSLPKGDRFGLHWGVSMLVDLEITRKNVWYADSATELPLSNGNGSDVTGGLAIENFHLTKDYVDIDETDIDGDLDAPIQLRITNNDASYKIGDLWVSRKALGSVPANFVHHLDASDSDTGGNSSDATCYAGFYRNYSVTTTDAKVTGWTLTTASLTAAAAGFSRVLVRFRNTTNITDVKWSLKLYTETGTDPIWEGGQYQFDDTEAEYVRLVRELDTVKLPLVDPEGDTPQPLRLELWGESTSGGAESIDLDTLKLHPLDGYRTLYSRDGVVQNAVLYDDGILGSVYQLVSSERVDDIVGGSKPIMVSPFEDNRVYFTYHTKTAGQAAIDHGATVQAYYRIGKRVL